MWKDSLKSFLKEDSMRGKILLVFLSLLLIVSAFAQGQSKVTGQQGGIKAVIDDELMVYTQVTPGDKPGIQTLTCYATDEDLGIMQMIKLNQNETIYWFIEYTAVFNTRVVFHYIWSGPEFYTFETDRYDGKYKNYSWVWVSTDNNWKKGTYTLTVIAENMSPKGGAEVVGSCRVRLY
jgi:hypothetical protein